MVTINLSAKNTKIDPLKLQYPIALRLTLLLAIVPVIALMVLFPRIEVGSTDIQLSRTDPFNNIEIPITYQNKLLLRPDRPAIPLESEKIDILDDVTIASTEIGDFGAWDDVLPLPKDGPDAIFVSYQEPPRPIGGFSAIINNVVYPPIARQAGIEGVVIVRAFIDKTGKVTETMIVKGLPKTGLDEAAMKAVKKTRFIPAKQREMPVGVWFDLKISFTLTG